MSESSSPSASAPPAKKANKRSPRNPKANAARRERVIRLLTEGKAPKEIAAITGLTESAIYLHRKKLNGGGRPTVREQAKRSGVSMATLVIARRLRKLAAERIVEKGGDVGELELEVLNFVQHLLRGSGET